MRSACVTGSGNLRVSLQVKGAAGGAPGQVLKGGSFRRLQVHQFRYLKLSISPFVAVFGVSEAPCKVSWTLRTGNERGGVILKSDHSRCDLCLLVLIDVLHFGLRRLEFMRDWNPAARVLFY